MKNRLLMLCGIAALFCIALQMLGIDLPLELLFGGSGCMAMAYPRGHNIFDAGLQVTKALPNGAATTATDGIKLNNGDRDTFTVQCELLIQAPALVVGDLADTKTMTYDIYHDDAAGFGTETLLAGAVIVQTGASGAGAAAAEYRFAIPSTVKSYIRVKATNNHTGDASDKSMTVSLVF